MYIGLQAKYPVFLADFNQKLIFLHRFSKNIQISNFMKVPSVGVDMLHADGRTDRHDEANNRNFETRSKIRYQISKPPVSPSSTSKHAEYFDQISLDLCTKFIMPLKPTQQHTWHFPVARSNNMADARKRKLGCKH
jgi:hypothetical protein